MFYKHETRYRKLSVILSDFVIYFYTTIVY